MAQNSIEKLTELFERFPGIGPRQARRFVHFLLTTSQATRAELAEAVKDLGSQTGQCKKCYRWFVKTAGRQGLCDICSNTNRDTGIIFVVEKDADIANIERSGFKGLYFCLGGTVPLATEEPEKHIRARELLARIETDGSKHLLKEVILGLSATTEGDHTGSFLSEKLRPVSAAFNFKISSLGRGLSTGSELEYADPDTISEALDNRH